MKSKMSFCNGTLLKKALFRGFPIWLVYLIAWVAFFPMAMISRADHITAYEAVRRVLQAVVPNSHIIPAFYGLAVACLVYSYLYKARSANFFAALPLKRETHFLTNYIAGLLYALIPNLIIAVLTLGAGAMCGAFLLKEILVWYGLSAAAYIFYFSFATLCAMLVGHLAALPVLYGILNFLAIVVESIVRSILEVYVFGMFYNGKPQFGFLSPLWYSMSDSHPKLQMGWDGDLLSGHGLINWEYIVILGVVGIGLAVLAFLLRKGRRMESAGDIIAVNSLKPVFLYCFTVGCSLVIGWILATFLLDEPNSANFIPAVLCLLTGALLGFFGGQMLLHKSLHIFRRQHWLSFSIVCAVITAAMLCCRLDIFGYARYAPQIDEIDSVCLDHYSETDRTSDADLIAKTVALHQNIIQQQEEIESSPEYNQKRILLTYKLTNGRIVTRQYYLPTQTGSALEKDSLIRQYEAIYNDPDFLIAQNLPKEYSAANISKAYVYNWKLSSEQHLTKEQAYRLLKHGIEADIRAGTLLARYWSQETKPTADKEESDNSVLMELMFHNVEDAWNNRYCSFTLTPSCTNSWKILQELGLNLP